MNPLFWTFLSASIISGFILTTLGGLPIFMFREIGHTRKYDILNAYAAGIMLAASIFSLLLPGLDLGGANAVGIGFVLGMMFILVLKDRVHVFYYKIKEEKAASNEVLLKAIVIFSAITLHNFPEGMSVGIAFASGITTLGFNVALAIGIQNIPEGFAVAVPLIKSGMSKKKAFLFSALSGIVEPINGIFGFFLVLYIKSLLSYMFGFCAGAMMFVVINEMIPEAQHDEYLDKSSLALMLGFLTMFILDVSLG